jgi:hypothetical protein
MRCILLFVCSKISHTHLSYSVITIEALCSFVSQSSLRVIEYVRSRLDVSESRRSSASVSCQSLPGDFDSYGKRREELSSSPAAYKVHAFEGKKETCSNDKWAAYPRVLSIRRTRLLRLHNSIMWVRLTHRRASLLRMHHDTHRLTPIPELLMRVVLPILGRRPLHLTSSENPSRLSPSPGCSRSPRIRRRILAASTAPRQIEEATPSRLRRLQATAPPNRPYNSLRADELAREQAGLERRETLL